MMKMGRLELGTSHRVGASSLTGGSTVLSGQGTRVREREKSVRDRTDPVFAYHDSWKQG